jgi:RNA polymerase sigma-70 factor, ECF subfamily
LIIAGPKMQSRLIPDSTTTLALEAKTDASAFGRLYNLYVQPVYRYLLSRVGSTHEAEDLTSQTFIAAYEALPKYRERGLFAAWLFRIARSKLNDQFRRSKHEVPIELAEGFDNREDALVRVILDDDIHRLRVLISNLDNSDQELIRLRYVADLSFPEIAELLGKREDAVKKSLYRLLAQLKGKME